MSPTNSSASLPRRTFVKSATAAGVGIMMSKTSPAFALGGPNDRVVVGVMGLNGRGIALARSFARVPNVEVAYLCDVDSKVLARSTTSLATVQQKAANGVADFRRMLDDKGVDAIVIAAPDHWHAPAAILAMNAGKHVYVEKPCGHNPHEGELIVQAQRAHQRVV